MSHHDLVATDEPLAFVGTLLRQAPPDRDAGSDRLLLPITDSLFPDDVIAPPPPREGPLDALVISDLHLGSENCQAKALVELLERVRDGVIDTRRLVINGDVFDSIDFRRLRKAHWKVLSRIRNLSDKMEVVWIAGNHDGPAEIVSHLLGVNVCEQYTFTTGERRVLCVHGHVFDDFIEDHPILTWIADAIYWALQKIDRTHYVARLAKHKSKIFVRCIAKIQRGAVELAREKHCQIVLCGHTHHATEDVVGDILYVNSGCWTEKPSTYLQVRAGAVSLCTFAAAEPTPENAASDKGDVVVAAAAMSAEASIPHCDTSPILRRARSHY